MGNVTAKVSNDSLSNEFLIDLGPDDLLVQLEGLEILSSDISHIGHCVYMAYGKPRLACSCLVHELIAASCSVRFVSQSPATTT